MKQKSLLLLIAILIYTNAKSQFTQIGLSGYYETTNLVNGVQIGDNGSTFTPAFTVRGDLVNTPTGEVFETVGLSSSTNAWRLKTINGSTISEMFRVMVSSGGVDASLDAVAGKLYLKTIGEEPMIFHTWNSERMRITSGGFVGMGTNAPATRLHVNGAGNATYLTVSNIASPSGFRFGVAASTDVAEIRQEENAELQI